MLARQAQSKWIQYGRERLLVQTAKIATVTGAGQQIVAATTGKITSVVAGFLNMDGAGTVTWLSATTALTGAASFGANAIAVLGWNPNFWLSTASGEALNVTVSANNLEGWLRYVVRTA